MTLSSQQARNRSFGARSGHYRRRKTGSALIVWAIVLVVLVGGGYALFSRLFGGDGEPAPTDSQAVTGAGNDSEVAPDPLTMGSAPPESQASSGVVEATPPVRVVEPSPTTVSDRSPRPSDRPRVSPEVRRPDPVAGAPTQAGGPGGAIGRLLERANDAEARNRPVEARDALNRILALDAADESVRATARTRIASLNERLVFSPMVAPNDPLALEYRVQGGDLLSRIVSKQGVAVPYRFIARINQLANPNALRQGQTLKLLRGPFHAVVDKSAFRLDLYAGSPPQRPASSRSDGAESDWIYIRSFRVGLGELGGTPLGNFRIKAGSKVENPGWRNPRTGEVFGANDEKNPIGEYWLAIEGLDEASRMHQSLGLHGTIEPESIGREMSMGCVRMLPEDIRMVWEILADGVSVVRVVE